MFHRHLQGEAEFGKRRVRKKYQIWKFWSKKTPRTFFYILYTLLIIYVCFSSEMNLLNLTKFIN